MTFRYPIFFLSCFIAIISCNEVPKQSSDQLTGVWSGILFQTESAFDSVVLEPASTPEVAVLYKDGTANKYDLVQEPGFLTFRGDGGLRLDASFSTNNQELFGVITHNLWSQSLYFEQAENKWTASIVKPEIIDTDYEVYLEFYKDSLNHLQAHIQSNKENRLLHFKVDSVLLDGNDIAFTISNDRFAMSAQLDPDKDQIKFNYGNPGGTRQIDLSRLPASELLGYKATSNASYQYQIPDSVGASIPTASLSSVGIQASLLDLIPAMQSGQYNHIHSIIITKNNQLVFEEYFHGYNRENLHDIRSSFKSIASLTFGKARMEDSSIRLDQSILDYYPGYGIEDAAKKKINLHQVLTMTTGLELEDEDDMQWNHADWVGHKLKLPMAHEPGTHYEYSSGGMNLLTGVIQHASSKYLPLFLYEKILRPMDIHRFQMRTSPMGRAYLPGDFYLRPIDFTKFGLLVMNNGQWKNKTIIDSAWVNTSTSAQVQGNWPKNSDYGYLWKMLSRNVNGQEFRTIEAWGNGGQFLIVIPALKMTVTFTGGNYNIFPEMEDKPFAILDQYILPAVDHSVE